MNRLLNSPGSLALRLLPMCLTLLSAGVVAQMASNLRMQTVRDDMALPSLMDFVHPAAAILIGLGFVLSCAVLVLPCGTAESGGQAAARPAQLQDEVVTDSAG